MEIILASSLLAAVISSIVSYVITSKQASVQYITGERKEWREKIREIAEKLEGADYNTTLKLITQLKVRVNAYGKTEIKQFRYDAHIWELIGQIENRKPEGSELRRKQRQLIDYLSIMLKSDWERSKAEAKGEEKFIIGWALIITSVIFFVTLGVGMILMNMEEDTIEFGSLLQYILYGFLIIASDWILRWMIHQISIYCINNNKLKEKKSYVKGKMVLCQISNWIFTIASGILCLRWGIMATEGEINNNLIICYSIHVTGLVLLAVKDYEKNNSQYYLNSSIYTARNQTDGGERILINGLIEKKRIISPGIQWMGIAGVIIGIVVSCCFYYKTDLLPLPEPKTDLVGILGMEVAILALAVTVLALVISFLNVRYLGASYKHWIFKVRIYLILPQELIFLMFCTLAVGIAAYCFSAFWVLIFTMEVLLWMLFLLCQRIYIATIKVSRLFHRIKQKLLKRTGNTQGLCEEIYNKISQFKHVEKGHNSYLLEETGIIIYMIREYTFQYQNAEGEQKKNIEIKCTKLVDKIIEMISLELNIDALSRIIKNGNIEFSCEDTLEEDKGEDNKALLIKKLKVWIGKEKQSMKFPLD